MIYSDKIRCNLNRIAEACQKLESLKAFENDENTLDEFLKTRDSIIEILTEVEASAENLTRYTRYAIGRLLD